LWAGGKIDATTKSWIDDHSTPIDGLLDLDNVRSFTLHETLVNSAPKRVCCNLNVVLGGTTTAPPATTTATTTTANNGGGSTPSPNDQNTPMPNATPQTTTSTTTKTTARTNNAGVEQVSSDDGLPGWAIALIVVFALLCCIVVAVVAAVVVRGMLRKRKHATARDLRANKRRDELSPRAPSGASHTLEANLTPSKARAADDDDDDRERDARYLPRESTTAADHSKVAETLTNSWQAAKDHSQRNNKSSGSSSKTSAKRAPQESMIRMSTYTGNHIRVT
jgi:hypothetical protein